jgi:hypothetical protein
MQSWLAGACRIEPDHQQLNILSMTHVAHTNVGMLSCHQTSIT